MSSIAIHLLAFSEPVNLQPCCVYSIKRFLSIPGDSELISLVLEGPNEFSKVHGSRAEVIQILDAVGNAHS